MRTKLSVTIILVVGLALVGTWTASAQGSEPLTLNINLGGDPLTLDPALAADTTSVTVIEQLFIGLVDLDDDTAEVRPELATSWTVSPDGTVYTFTLRSDVYWTDGHRVTAGDVRYGILRTLNPATQSYYAFALYIIKNAEAYNTGAITDPNQVGVAALDDTHLRITLEYPASYVLSILSLWVARPMPQWAIDRWGSAWTDPAHIVTSGPYRLTEWVHDDHILLDRNPTYYDAVNVQIERVKMWMVDESTAWTMYLNGQLDTAGIPAGHMGDVPSQEVHIQPIACTYYYGFSVSQAPFNNPLVRKAFAAATDREGLVNTLFGGVQRPALTFTPPGVFGHVDGYAEGVGIPYNPTQARQWLAQAGYPNGQGLPPVTLWFNTSPGHQAIAEYIRNSWYTTLGVSVTLQSLSWSDYLSQLPNGQFQIWRLGWCMDYPDANNFLNDGVHRPNFGNWHNATYESLLDQAAREQNPDTRKALYKQAEEILVETDAVMLPLYYYTSVLAVKPYLERTYAPGGEFDIATWRIRVSGTARVYLPLILRSR
jgi:oligopeptide transport system substrate-binding protein